MGDISFPIFDKGGMAYVIIPPMLWKVSNILIYLYKYSEYQQILLWKRLIFNDSRKVYQKFFCINNIAPSYLSELLSQYSPTCTLCSGNKQLLQETKSNRSWGDRSFAIAAPRLWNELPFNIRTANSITVFKKQLKTHLMSETFSKV